MKIDKSVKNLSYSIYGNGNPVLFLHGLLSSRREWSVLSKELAIVGFQSYSPDLFGHGNSSKPNEISMYTSNYQIQTIKHWINKLSINSQYDIIGHSFGGFLALQIASLHPNKVRKIILINPLYNIKQLSKIHDFIFSKPELPIKYWQRLQQLLKIETPSPLILNLLKDFDKNTIDFHKVTQPVMVVWGERDKTLDPSSFYSLIKQLKNVTACPLPKHGHVPHRSYPEYINKLIVDFLLPRHLSTEKEIHPKSTGLQK
jgi:pimeloyl-ACP methyl ester carboxylesterase